MRVFSFVGPARRFASTAGSGSGGVSVAGSSFTVVSTSVPDVVADFAAKGHVIPGDSLADIVAALDTHVGTPEDVLESLSRDTTLPRVTDLVFQVHSVDPPHEYILRSIELIANEVAPALGWQAPVTKPEKRVALVR